MPTVVTGLSSLFEEGESTSSFQWTFISQEVLMRAVILLVLGAVLIPMLLKLVGRMLSKSKRLQFIQSYLLSATRIFLWFLLLVMVADSLSIPMNSIFTLMGVAGLALSLALQNTLSNLAGGLQVLVSKPFEVGDYIDTEQGSGTVAEIGLAYSKLTTIDNKEVMIPNNLIASSKIINHTGSGVRRVDVEFSVSYDAETKVVRKALLEMCEHIPHIHGSPEPVVYLTAYGDSAITYSLRVWTSSEEYWTVYFALMEEGRETFKKHGVEIPYNHLNVHMIPPFVGHSPTGSAEEAKKL